MFRALSCRVAIAAALAAGCATTASAPAPAPTPADRGGPEALRFRAAEAPADGRARAALGLVLDREGMPGAALVELQRAARLGGLWPAARARLAALLVARARARVSAGDALAVDDLSEAQALGASPPPELVADAARAALLAALRDTGAADAQVEALARRLAQRAPGDPALAVLPSAAAAPERLAAAGSWAWRNGARARGRVLLGLYVRGGGRDPATLALWLAAERWWSGQEGSPSPLAIYVAGRAGVDVCALAYAPDDDACRLHAVPSRAVWARAVTLGWRTAEPRTAAALVGGAAAAWLVGAAPAWLESAAEYLELEPLRARLDEVPVYARAAVARALGAPEVAAAALDAAVARAGAMSAAERGVVLVEAVVQGRGRDTLAVVTAAGPVPAWAELAVAAGARAAGDAQAEQTALSGGSELASSYLAARGDLARAGARDRRWAPRAAQLGEALALTAHEAPTVARAGDPTWIARGAGTAGETRALARIAAAHGRDRGIARRLAQDWIAGHVYSGARAPGVIELFLRVGDVAAAREVADQLLATSPRHPPLAMLAATAAAAAGQVERAEWLIALAATRSGDPGVTYAAAMAVFAAYDQGIAALAAGRQALAFTPPGEDIALLERLVGTLERLGRADDARAAREALAGRRGPGPRGAELAIAPEPRWGLTAAMGADDASQAEAMLRAALAWTPRCVELHRALLAQLPAGSATHRDAFEALLAVAIAADGAQRVRALAAVADEAAVLGLERLAQVLRDELARAIAVAARSGDAVSDASAAAGASARRTLGP